MYFFVQKSLILRKYVLFLLICLNLFILALVWCYFLLWMDRNVIWELKCNFYAILGQKTSFICKNHVFLWIIFKFAYLSKLKQKRFLYLLSGQMKWAKGGYFDYFAILGGNLNFYLKIADFWKNLYYFEMLYYL